ncbi:ATP/GTP-binding protein [Streptomyces collinus]|uniref:ATP/GTP-binding protein n=1 Tax=Streptomyces collinus TaxID=42684 RepID=UPI0033CAF5A5
MMSRLRGRRAAKEGQESSEVWNGEAWTVRHAASGGAEGQMYRCPGCDQALPSGVSRVVAWPSNSAVQERRHWHKACWNARNRSSARVSRTRV